MRTNPISVKNLLQRNSLFSKHYGGVWARRLAWLGRRPHTAESFISLLDALLRGELSRKESRPVIRLPVPEELEGFKAYLVTKGKSERTIRERIRYLERLVDELGMTPSVNDLLSFLAERSPHERDHFRKALRLWLSYSGQKEALEYLSGGWVRTEARDVGVGLEEALEAIRIAWSVEPKYALYLILLLVTGLRPSELRSVKRSGQVLPLIFSIEKPNTATKRHSYAFLTPTSLELRDKVLGRYERLVFWRREIEYKALKGIRESLPGFRPYALRALNAELLLRGGVPEAIIDYIQGRAPETVLRKHYLHKQMTRQEMLLDILDQHNKALKDVDNWIRRELLK